MGTNDLFSIFGDLNLKIFPFRGQRSTLFEMCPLAGFRRQMEKWALPSSEPAKEILVEPRLQTSTRAFSGPETSACQVLGRTNRFLAKS